MDTGELKPASRRGGRALLMIIVALVALGGASLVYLRPAASRGSPASPPQVVSPLLAGPSDGVAYDFWSPSLGWALDVAKPSPDGLGRFWVFRTVDGTSHWQRQLAGQVSLSGGGTFAIQFFDSARGFVVVGYPIELHRTVDGGAHWNMAHLPKTQIDFMTFSDPSHGWFLANTPASPNPKLHLYETGDAGDTWQELPDPPFDSIRMTFRSPAEGWMWSSGGGHPHVYRSIDGGRSWERHDMPEPPTGTLGVQPLATTVRLLPDAGVAVAVSPDPSSAYEYTSFDGGASWTYVPRRATEVFAGGESYEDSHRWWVIDQGVLYKSSDAGQTWTRASDPLPNGRYWQYLVHVIDSNDAWAEIAIGEGSGLALTHDGGAHWTRVQVPQPG
jgi:photosystem II stability/assembly factor-like uncharacterized protein